MRSIDSVTPINPVPRKRAAFRRALLSSAFTAGLLLYNGATFGMGSSALAAESVSDEAPVSEDVEALVVTGSRIVRDGYKAPTPVNVVGAEELQTSAGTNISDVLRTVPAFAGSVTPATGITSVSANGAGLNLLNLRSMGSNRTLILIDGQRSVSARADGVVDVNTIPQQLVQRVDVVTGGASAIYGSDAVTGVVNFVLDKTFTGVKAEVSGGVTTYGDDRNYKIAITAGTPFANGRGHFIISGEVNNKDGVLDNYRPWNMSQLGIIQNSAANVAAGQPQRLVRTGVDSWFTRGGTIDGGPLRGIHFGEGGTPYNFVFGSITDGSYTAGGDSRLGTIRNDTGTLDPMEKRQSAFTRLSYYITDDINLFAQASWNRSHTFNWAFSHFMLNQGSTVRSGNPFIPASVQAQMTALGVTSFRVSGMNYDLPWIGPDSDRRTMRYVLGAEGRLDALGSRWSWDAYWQRGVTLLSYTAVGATRKSLRDQAADAVIDPRSGAIVCRSTLTNPGDGCVPYNNMGLGVNSEAVINFITMGYNYPHKNDRLQLDVVAGSLSGEPFSTWAGPVSMAFSGEYRKEKGRSVPTSYTLFGDWHSGNFFPFAGESSVYEGAVETVIPLASDVAWADSWDVSAALRATKYSVSGRVTTYKIGTTYQPISDIRLRATRSRDIRAPNLQDLYNKVSGGFGPTFDPVVNATVNVLNTTEGNPALKPEKADTTSFGVVVQPRFLMGFSASVDYWNIDLQDAIASPSTTQIINFCFQGIQSYCSDLTRGGVNNALTAAIRRPVNIAKQITRGIDFEASYGFRLDDLIPSWSGMVNMNLQMTKYLKNYSDTTLAPPTDNVGEMGGGAPPHWALTARVGYTGATWKTGVTARAMSSGVLHNEWIECQSACPRVVAPAITIDDNSAPGFLYFDWNISKDLEIMGRQSEVFLNINNIFNKDPGFIPKGADEIGYEISLSNPSKYDVLGRVFRAGIRIRM